MTEKEQLMTRLTIRDARESDRARIVEVTLAAYQEYSTMMPPSAWEGYRESIISTLSHPAPAEQIIAKKDGELVGAVLLYPSGTPLEDPDAESMPFEVPEIRLLAVTPAARGQGVGKALMDECISRARLAGATAVGLHTTEMMAVGKQMYERMGFVHLPELDFHPAPGLVVLGYRLQLSDHFL